MQEKEGIFHQVIAKNPKFLASNGGSNKEVISNEVK